MGNDSHSLRRVVASAAHWWPAAAASATFLAELAVCRPLISAYFPTTDDIALEAVSTPIGGATDPAVWIKHGFHGYFDPYPEWGTTVHTDFWRPLANVLFWLHYRLFGDHWSSQLVVGYLAHAVVVGLTAHLALNVFRLGRPLALMAVLIAAVNPAVCSRYEWVHSIPGPLQFPMFQTDIGCGLLMLVAIFAFLGGRYLLFGILATFALLLKETALPLPVSALVLTGAWASKDRMKTTKNGLCLVMPLVIWFSSRYALLEHGDALGVMDQTNRFGWVTQPIRNAFLWPTGLYWGPLGQTRRDLALHAWEALATQGIQLFANALWWVGLGVALVHTVRPFGRRWFVDPPQPAVAALVFALGNLAFVLVLPLTAVRYGYLWFALGPAALFAALSRARRPALTAALLTAALLLPRAGSLRGVFSRDSIARYQTAKRAGKSLAALLGRLPAGVKKAYVVDDLAVQPAAPKYMAKLSGFRGELVLINSILPVERCQPRPVTAARYRLRREGAADVLEYQAPECFEHAWRNAPVGLMDDRNVLKRGEWISYSFPDLSWRDASLVVKTARAYDEGKHWSVRVSDPACSEMGECVWLGFDERADGYYVLAYDGEQSAETK